MFDINDAGQIIVLASTAQESGRALILTPTQMNGDVNCDGLVTVADIGPFVMALTDPAAYAAQFPNCAFLNGDINGDGLLTVSDIGGFVAALTGG